MKIKFKRAIKAAFVLGLWLTALSPFIALYFFLNVANDSTLPGFEQLENPKTNLASVIYTSDIELIGKYYKNDKINSASDLCMYYLNEAKVSLVPGEDFGAPNCIRLSYAASEKDLIEAVNRLKNSTNNLT